MNACAHIHAASLAESMPTVGRHHGKFIISIIRGMAGVTRTTVHGCKSTLSLSQNHHLFIFIEIAEPNHESELYQCCLINTVYSQCHLNNPILSYKLLMNPSKKQKPSKSKGEKTNLLLDNIQAPFSCSGNLDTLLPFKLFLYS